MYVGAVGVLCEPTGQASYSERFSHSDHRAFLSVVGVCPRDADIDGPCFNMRPFGKLRIS